MATPVHGSQDKVPAVYPRHQSKGVYFADCTRTLRGISLSVYIAKLPVAESVILFSLFVLTNAGHQSHVDVSFA